MLPLIVTVCLSRGARAMASGKAIVRRLDAIETLGGMEITPEILRKLVEGLR